MVVSTPVGTGHAGAVARPVGASHSMLRSARASITLSGLGVLLGLVSVPVMVSGLGYADYGAYSIAFTIAGYGAFLDLGFGWAGMRFTADAHARHDAAAVAGVLWALVLYQALVGGVVAALLVAGADRVGHWLTAGPGADAARVAGVLPIAGAWFAISGVNGIFVGVLRGVGRYATAAIVAGTALVLGVGGSAVAVALGRGLRAAALWQVIGALAAAAVASVALRDVLAAAPTGGVITSSARQLRRMLGFSLWSLLSRLVQVAVLQGDKAMAAGAAGVVGLPTYVVPFNVAQRLNALGAAAVTAVYPVAAGRHQSRHEFVDSYFRAARVVHLCTAAPAITLLVWAPLFLSSWIGPEMASSGAGFLRALALGYWVMSVGSVEAGCLEGWGHPRVTALGAVAGVVVAVAVALVLASTRGSLWAVAGGVAAWMVSTGLVNVIAWYRVAGFPAARLGKELARPIGEMVVLGVTVGWLVGGWVAPGPWGLLACGGLIGLLLVYGFVRLFPGGEGRALLGRVVSVAAP